MKKALSILLIIGVLVGTTACGKKVEVDKEAIIQEYLQEQAEKQEKEDSSSTASETELSENTATFDEPEVIEEEASVSMEKYLYNDSDTPVVFYSNAREDKNCIPDRIWLFLKGKVKILPNVLRYTMADISKMDDAEIIQATEEELEKELQAYVDNYDEMIETFLNDEKDPRFKYYAVTDIMGDFRYTHELHDWFMTLDGQENTIAEALSAVYNEDYWANNTIMFRPYEYHMPEYIDYVIAAETDNTGNNIHHVSMYLDDECCFTGSLEYVAKNIGWMIVYGGENTKTVEPLEMELEGITADMYAVHNWKRSVMGSDVDEENEGYHFFGENWGQNMNCLTLGNRPTTKPVEYMFELEGVDLFSFDGKAGVILDTEFFFVNGLLPKTFVTKDANIVNVTPDSRFYQQDENMVWRFGVPVDYSLDGIAYLIDPEMEDICTYFNTLHQ